MVLKDMLHLSKSREQGHVAGLFRSMRLPPAMRPTNPDWQGFA